METLFNCGFNLFIMNYTINRITDAIPETSIVSPVFIYAVSSVVLSSGILIMISSNKNG